jgi:hypothetical protein
MIVRKYAKRLKGKGIERIEINGNKKCSGESENSKESRMTKSRKIMNEEER